MMWVVVALLFLSLLAEPVAVEAQPARIPRIGYLGNGGPTTGRATHEAFRQGLCNLGWIKGQAVTIETRPAPEVYSAILDCDGGLV